MERRSKQDLYIKIQNLIPSVFSLISSKYKNIREKFIMPVKDEETGLLFYDMTNEEYGNYGIKNCELKEYTF